jgi:hypothetical protein
VKDQRGIVARVAEVIARTTSISILWSRAPIYPMTPYRSSTTVEPISEPTIRAVVDVINTFELMVEPALLLRVGIATFTAGSEPVRLRLRHQPPTKKLLLKVRSVSATTNSNNALPGPTTAVESRPLSD